MATVPARPATPGGGRWRAAVIHLGVVGLSFVLSILVLRNDGPVPHGDAADGVVCMACGFLVIHSAVGIVGVCLRRATVRSCLVLFAAAFFPAGTEAVLLGYRAYRHHYHLPYDRFRDHLASPIPESVSHVRFVPLEEKIQSNLMIRFDIAPADLEAILRRLGLKRVAPDQLLDPEDFFRFPYYLPLDGDPHLYQGTDSSGAVLTIKTNEAHAHAIFRMETSSDRDRPDWWKQMEREGLDRLRREYEARK